MAAPRALSTTELFDSLRSDVLAQLIESSDTAAVPAHQNWRDISRLLPSSRSRGRVGKTVRRSIDIAVAGLLLVLLFPVLAVTSLAVWLEDRGPVFFGHPRVGRRGQTFTCWKFRSMRSAAGDLRRDPELWATYVRADFKIRDAADPRITRVGTFIRSTYIDELPQLWNVIRGQMSLFGPRPVVRDELAWYGPFVQEFLSVRPGISGAWQLTDHVRYPERVFVELSYIRLRSLWLDLRLTGLTLAALLTGRGCVVEILMPPHYRGSAHPREEWVEVLAGPVVSDG